MKQAEKECRIMVFYHDAGNGPVMKAAKIALGTTMPITF
jgi:hypothetical protein